MYSDHKIKKVTVLILALFCAACSGKSEGIDTIIIPAPIPEKCAFDIPVGLLLGIKLHQEADGDIDDIIKINSRIEKFVQDKSLMAQSYDDWLVAKQNPPYSKKESFRMVNHQKLEKICDKVSQKEFEDVYLAAFGFATYVLVNEKKYLTSETLGENAP